MDRLRFDAIARLLATTGSRRRTLGALLGAALLGHTVEALAKPGGKRRGNGKGKNNNRRRKIKAQAVPASCFSGAACIPGPAAYLAKCDFTDSTLLAGVNCSKSNLSDASLLRANASGANFTKANMSRVCFVDADLTGATLAASTNLLGAVFCRTTMPDGSTSNSGCSKSTKCCQTCIELGNACGVGIGGSCCGGNVCSGGVCSCILANQACTSSTDNCCDTDYVCADDNCATPLGCCGTTGASCSASCDCCGTSSCSGGSCT